MLINNMFIFLECLNKIIIQNLLNKAVPFREFISNQLNWKLTKYKFEKKCAFIV